MHRESAAEIETLRAGALMPRWVDGHPDNTTAALADALTWLKILQARSRAVGMDAENLDRLDCCIEAAAGFLPPNAQGEAPRSGRLECRVGRHEQTKETMISNDDIKREFLEVGFTVKPGHDDLKPYVYEAARGVIALAVAAERERCARACEEEARNWHDLQNVRDFKLCAARIRSGA